jgi:integration host factor subunit beta
VTKSDLVKRLADANPHLYRRDLERIVATVFDRVELRGFGAFSTRTRGAQPAHRRRGGGAGQDGPALPDRQGAARPPHGRRLSASPRRIARD